MNSLALILEGLCWFPRAYFSTKTGAKAASVATVLSVFGRSCRAGTRGQGFHEWAVYCVGSLAALIAWMGNHMAVGRGRASD